MSKFCLIVAVSDNGVIGRDGKLPWHFPEDLQSFKELTMGKPCVMGRKTFLDIGRPLPGRKNIVVTSSPTGHEHPDLIEVPSLTEAMAMAVGFEADRVFFIGGSRIFQEAIKWCSEYYITRIKDHVEGDTHLGIRPDRTKFRCVSRRLVRTTSPKNPGLVGIFERWVRKD